MSPRDTTTGAVLESMIEPALQRAGYSFVRQAQVADVIPGKKKHYVDRVVTDAAGEKIALSLKWQQVSGTADEKVPFEFIRLGLLTERGEFARAYIILAGGGWKPDLKMFYTKHLSQVIKVGEYVKVLDLYEFVAQVNKRKI